MLKLKKEVEKVIVETFKVLVKGVDFRPGNN